MSPERVCIASGEIGLAGHLYLPSGGAGGAPGVVICHGLGSRKERHGDFAALLRDRGFAVLAFDLRGHGESEGELDSGVVGDVLAAVEHLAGCPRVDPGRIALRGSSLGGQLAIHATAASDRVRAVAALCPAHESLMRGRPEDPRYEAAVRQLESEIRLNRESFGRYLAERDVEASARRISPRALLLIHCRGDEVVPFPLSERLIEVAGEPKDLWALEGGSHTWAQHDPGVQLGVARWLEEQLA